MLPSSLQLGSSFDPAGQRLFLATSSALYTIHVATNTVTQVPLPAGASFGFLEYDPVTGLVYTAEQVGPSSRILIGVDPVSGAVVPGPPLPSSFLTGSGFDPATRRLFLLTSSSLVTTNVTTGVTTQVPAPANAFTLLDYDPVSGQVYVARDVAPGNRVATAVDPVTGAPVDGPALPSFHDGTGIDPAGRRLFLQDATGVVSINVVTGVSTHVTVPGGTFGFLEFASATPDVPVLGGGTLLLFGVLLAAAGLLRLGSA